MQPLNRLRLDPVQPSDASALQMENELLRHEISHLRARLAVAEPRSSRASAAGPAAKAKPAKGKPAKPAPSGKQSSSQAGTQSGAATPGPEAARNAAAYDDLVWLLGRLDTSPAGPLLRRVEGFRTLRARYLPEPPA